MSLYLLPDFLAIGGLFAIFVSLLRRTRQTRMRSWALGWALLLTHILAEFIAVNIHTASDAAYAVASITLLLASVAFIWAALEAPLQRWRFLARLAAVELPNVVFIVLLFSNAGTPAAYVTLSIAGALGSLLLVRAGARISDRKERWVFVLGILFAYSAQAALSAYGHPDYAFDWMLCWHYLAVATLFWRSARHVTPGTVFTTLSFVAWASVFPVAELLHVLAPSVHVESEVWNLPKYLVATGMILTLLEEQMTVAEEAAQHDDLTGLPNRRLFDRRLLQAFALADRSGGRMALLAIDLDRFKQINDRYGHPAGDEVLMTLARRLSERLRKGDTLARVGGDEFIAILPEVPDRAAADVVAGALTAALQIPVDLPDARVMVGVSIGVTVYPDDAQDANGLMALADRRMYASKGMEAPSAYAEP
ncbi:diguanylate cyclase/phosphodiesterase with PAS/PAC sensor(s) [mine drainage metagenome]|uniref:Diguanylate cyclase/phosphodiesterase with PAS/PAC sensor(S) n=1 Tax=mine drainage metagenome TaxID=410659 RepID=T1CBZ9_9ZZZZ